MTVHRLARAAVFATIALGLAGCDFGPPSASRQMGSGPTASLAGVTPTDGVSATPRAVEIREPATFSGLVAQGDGFALLGATAEAGSTFIVRGSNGGTDWRAFDAGPFAATPVSLAAGPAGWVVSEPIAAPTVPGAGVRLWYSRDGSEWVAVPDQAGLGTAFPDALSAGPAGFAMVGQVLDGFGTSLPTAWTSPDGQRWSEVANLREAGVDRIFVLDQGFVALASGSTGAAPNLVTSPDGEHWQPVSSGPIAVTSAGSNAEVLMVATGSKLLAWRVEAGSGQVSVWAGTASPHGTLLEVAWTHLADADAAFQGAGLSAAVETSERATVLGYDIQTGDPLAWTSTDGATWRRTELDRSTFGGGVPGGVAASGADVVALGFVVNRSGAARRQLWASADGVAWRAVGGDVLGVPGPDASGPCPASAPSAVAEVLALAPPLWPVCFGDEALHLGGVVHDCGGCGGATGLVAVPSWLLDPLGYADAWLGDAAAAEQVPMVFAPDAEDRVPADGTTVVVDGHFDDPASATCRLMPGRGSIGELQPAAAAVATCEQTFVITRIQPGG